MIGRLLALLRGGPGEPPVDPLAPFPEGAAVSVLVHPEAWLFQPLYRSLYARGPISMHSMPLDHAIRCDATAPEVELGAALRRAFGTIITVNGRAPVAPIDPRDQRSGGDALRPVLGLSPRASVWKGTVSVSVRVIDARLLVSPARAEGRAGGFAGWRGRPDQYLDLQADDADLGAALVASAEAARGPH